MPEERSKAEGPLLVMDTPRKSPNDRKEYKVVRLPNGVVAMLISDLDSTCNSSSSEVEMGTEDVTIPMTDCEDEDEDGDDDDDDDNDNMEEDEDQTDLTESDSEEGSRSRRLSGSISNAGSGKRSQQGEKMAAAALTIHVGSFSDPEEIPGLAHFLEHMVFMGSQKYPSENSFDAFTKKHGGSDNASTDCESTTFHFEVQAKYFREGLDRFSQFFVSPLLKRESMQREREAVDSEFQMALPSDHFRRQQLLGSFARPGHPMAKFMWGNLQTLKGSVTEDCLHQALNDFRHCHYTAEKMRLCVQAPEPLASLERWVRDSFGEVPHSAKEENQNYLNAWQDEGEEHNGEVWNDPFETASFSKLYRMVPMEQGHQLDLTWRLPCVRCHFRSKPLGYVSWLVGHEGRGSLLAYLRRRVWAVALCSGVGESGFDHNTTCALFSINVELTDAGLADLKKVLNAIFSYLRMLQQLGPEERIFREMQEVEELAFRYAEECPPVDYVEGLSENMLHLPPSEYITGETLLYTYNPKLIAKYMDELRPETVSIMVSSKQFDSICDLRETWFNTPYSVEDIPSDWVSEWQSATPLPDFHLPERNRFLATDCTVLPPPKDETHGSYPRRLVYDGQCELWFRQDDVFLTPKAYFCLFLVSPLPMASPLEAAILDLMVVMLQHHLVEDAYPAEVALLEYNLYPDARGLRIQVHGFNDKLSLLLEEVVDHLGTFETQAVSRPDVFEALKIELMKRYHNAFLQPGKLCKDVRLATLQHVHWTSLDKHAALQGLQMEQLLAFATNFRKHLFLQVLAQGNVTAEQAMKVVKGLTKRIGCQPLLPNTLPEMRVVELPQGEHILRASAFNAEDTNSVVTNYYQAGRADIHSCCILESVMMLMEEPVFDVLRTREQLGYHVYAMLRNTFGILGFSITVHSQKFSVWHVDERIEEFLRVFMKQLQEMSEESLEVVVQSLIRSRKCVDLQLEEEVTRNWEEIASGEYIFDRRQREIDCFQNITLKEVQSWFACLLSHQDGRPTLRKLGVQVVSLCPLSMPVKKDESGKGHVRNTHSGHSLNVRRNSGSHKKKPILHSPSVYYGGKVLFPLELLPSDPCRPEEPLISSIEAFKNHLYIYPVNRIIS